MSAPALAVGARVLVAEPVRGSDTVTRLVDGVVRAYVSDRVEVETEHASKWYPLALVVPVVKPDVEMRAQAAMLGHTGPALMVRLPAAPIETIPTEVACVPSDTTIANLARAHTASIMEWNRAHATTEPSHEDAMAIFERRDRTLFALLDALHPGWREVYDAAWGEEGRARRAAARAGVEGEVSP